MTVHALASSATADHYTPQYIIDRVRLTLGHIDLDPASCHAANEIVGATRYFTEDVDGLAHPWFGAVFINPPGDPSGKLPQRFWEKLAWHVAAHDVTSFVWLAFNVSHLRTLQGVSEGWDLLDECDVCIPSSRIRFTGSSPTKDNAILYWGPNRRAFARNFRDLGTVWRAAR